MASSKATVQGVMTTTEAAFATMQKQEDMAKSNGPDSERIALVALAAQMVLLRAEIEALP